MKLLSGLIRHARRRGRERDQALSLYIAAVEQARRPGFYTDCGVADSLDGRFDLIVLHVFLVVRALRPSGEPGKRLSDLMFKIMMDDMDMNLREMGVGDLSVGKRVKSMARAFYGRAAAYDAAFDAERDAAPDAAVEERLEATLQRNIYGAEEPDPGALALLLGYVSRAETALAAEPAADLLSGQVTFAVAPGDPPASERAE
ncbi:MAG: ubiquinol-cytochrome C chaperone family protein [Proteobacteria bacterium]|nr:ubiquinol-cytochrome C chaperone family protein [Pseudomonadota bacterium]MDA1356805.1 ubiquinol-cytochrome C chaperone family protein [Pseudomonadota bacterium]